MVIFVFQIVFSIIDRRLHYSYRCPLLSELGGDGSFDTTEKSSAPAKVPKVDKVAAPSSGGIKFDEASSKALSDELSPDEVAVSCLSLLSLLSLLTITAITTITTITTITFVDFIVSTHARS